MQSRRMLEPNPLSPVWKIYIHARHNINRLPFPKLDVAPHLEGDDLAAGHSPWREQSLDEEGKLWSCQGGILGGPILGQQV